MKGLVLAAALVLSALQAAAAETATPPAEANVTRAIPEVLAAEGSSTFAKLVESSGMTETLRGKGPLTCFAPTDQAFAALPQGSVEKLLDPANREKLKKWISYLVIEGEVTEEGLMRSRRIQSLSGDFLTIWVANGTIKLNNKAGLVAKDRKASNGIVHTLDRLIAAPEEKEAPKP
jgi:uncharacterized surface protein with fasciclin (FAS1) repeats